MERQFLIDIVGCMISICCVGLASLDVVCDELNDWPGMFVCSSFLISVCILCRKLCSYRVLQ